MSLIRIALRLAAVEAIKGKTLVGENVLDTPNGALDIVADGNLRIGEDRPFVSVYTDEGVAEGITGRSLTANGRCVLVIEAGISTAMTETNDDGESVVVGVGVPASDHAFEFYLGVVHRQIIDALTDPDGEWAEIYRALHRRVVKTEIAGKRNTDDGQRLAGIQYRITLDLVDDPVRGEALALDAPIVRFLDAYERETKGTEAEQVALLRTLVGGEDPDWKIAQRRRGMTRDELRAVGLGPIAQDLERETPPLTEGNVDVRESGHV